MRNVVFAGAASLAMIALAFGSAAAAPGADPQRYILALTHDAGHRPGDSYGSDRVVAFIDGLNFVVVETRDARGLEARARADGAVRYVQLDDPLAATLSFTPNDALYSNAGHWGSKKIGAEAAWDRTTGSTAVKVAMIDSGLLKSHEEFAGSTRVLQGWDFVYNDNDPNDQGSSCGYHGTHTTGTAGATIHNGKGIAGMSQHTILPIKVFYPVNILQCGSSTTALVNALKYSADQGAHISSNSWGSGGSDAAINDAVQYAHDRGVVHVGAAGNSGSCTNCVSYPWKAKAAVTIVVSATTSSDGFASFSSEGPEVDVAAPGAGILSSCGGSTNSYCTYDGTSMATPHVAGTAALLKALNPAWGFADLDARLKSTAVDLGATGVDARFGHGRIDANAATLGGTTPPPAACGDGVDNDGDGLVDYPADPGCTSSTDTDETNAPPPPPAGITLTADGYKVKGVQRADLAWSGATTTSVDVYRNGALVATTANDGAHTDAIGAKGGGSYDYRLCEAGTTTCSATVRVVF